MPNIAAAASAVTVKTRAGGRFSGKSAIAFMSDRVDTDVYR
jgi:hypothetical protein